MKVKKQYKYFFVIPVMLFFVSFNVSSEIITYVEDKWSDSRYIDHGDGTVTDTKTGLMWQKCGGKDTTLDCSGSNAALFFWHELLDYASTSTLAGYTDWRVPNIKELLSLVAFNRTSPSINSTVFPTVYYASQGFNVADRSYGTSSPITRYDNGIFAVNFRTGAPRGGVRSGDTDQYYYLRMVRK